MSEKMVMSLNLQKSVCACGVTQVQKEELSTMDSNSVPEAQAEVVISDDDDDNASNSSPFKETGSKNGSQTDPKGYYMWVENEAFRSQFQPYEYQIVEKLGQGSFGQALKCLKYQTIDGHRLVAGPVAVKISRSGRTNLRWAISEARNLMRMKNATEFCVQIQDWFLHKGHFCIVLELLDVTLFDYVREKDQNKMPLAIIRRIISDALQGLAKLKEIGIVHADLKPDNMMLNRVTFRTKLIDFGWAHKVDEQHDVGEGSMQNLFYRAPEIVLDHPLGYSFGIDMWSLGCILGELLTNRLLYPGKCNYDLLRYIVQSQGQPSQNLVQICRTRDVYFTQLGKKRIWALKTQYDFLDQVVDKKKNHDLVIYLRQEILELSSLHTKNMPNDLTGEDLKAELLDREMLGDLLRQMLQWDQLKRISPIEALDHSFFTMAHLSKHRNLERVRASLRLFGAEVVQQDVKGTKRSADCLLDDVRGRRPLRRCRLMTKKNG